MHNNITTRSIGPNLYWNNVFSFLKIFIDIDICCPTAKANFEFCRESEFAYSNIATDSNRTLVYIFYPMDLKFLVELSSKFVTALFADELSLQLSFHSANHTGNVVAAAKEIGIKVG